MTCIDMASHSAPMIDEFERSSANGISLPASPSPRSLKSSRCPPHLTDTFLDESQFEHINFPETPSPSNGSFAVWPCTAQGESCVVPRTPSPSGGRLASTAELWSNPQYNFDFNGHMQDISMAYLAPVVMSGPFDAPAGIDWSSWDQGQQVLPPSGWNYQTLNSVHNINVDVHQECISQSSQDIMLGNPVHQEIKDKLIDVGFRRVPSLENLPRSRKQAHSPRRALIKTRWGMKEIEVVSSQASTADTAEMVNEEGVEQLATSRPSFENCASCVSLDPDDSSFNIAPSHGQPQVLNLEHMLGHASEHMAVGPFYDSSSFDDSHPQLGSSSLPSIGSMNHRMNRCKPCAFVTRTGCSNGIQCIFCHLCEPGEKKRRRKEKKALFMARRSLAASFPSE